MIKSINHLLAQNKCKEGILHTSKRLLPTRMTFVAPMQSQLKNNRDHTVKVPLSTADGNMIAWLLHVLIQTTLTPFVNWFNLEKRPWTHTSIVGKDLDPSGDNALRKFYNETYHLSMPFPSYCHSHSWYHLLNAPGKQLHCLQLPIMEGS